MASSAEGRMNLAALQQRDPFITSIVDTASQVALYLYKRISNEWEKTDIEGTLFVYSRSATPINGVMILNRLGLNDLIEPLTKDVEFQLQDPFLLYRNAQGSIYGVWFYDNDECARIGQLMNSLVQVAIEKYEQKDLSNRHRRASESDSSQPSYSELLTNHSSNVDIMQLLSNAQNDYMRRKMAVEPKPILESSGKSPINLSAGLIKPCPLKASSSKDAHIPDLNTQISLDALFQRASVNSTVDLLVPPSSRKLPTPDISPTITTSGTFSNSISSQASHSNIMPSLLQRIMTNPGVTVEEIERKQRGETPRDQMPKPAGAEAPNSNHQKILTKSMMNKCIDEENSTVSLTKTLMSSCKMGRSSPTRQLTLKRNSSLQENISPSINLSASAPSLQLNAEFNSLSYKTQSNLEHLPNKLAELSFASSHLPHIKPSSLSDNIISSPSSKLIFSINHSTLNSENSSLNNYICSSQHLNNADVLLTPEAFKCSSPSYMKEANNFTVLTPPTCFESTKYDSSRILLGSSSEHLSEPIPCNSLSKEQLQHTLVNLLQNDHDFLNSIHEAYTKQMFKSGMLNL